MFNFSRVKNALSRSKPADAKRSLLEEINAEVPRGVDWAKGAQDYVAAEIGKHGRDWYTRYLLSKPLAAVPASTSGKTGGATLIENCAYLANFINAAAVLDLPGGSRILDCACGSGWVAQFFTRMNYEAYGFDISRDMIDLAQRRFSEDTLLRDTSNEAKSRFFVLDIEREPLPHGLHGTFDAIILESCLHHFEDPVSALEHLTDGLTTDGVVVIIEGENRSGAIRQEYLDVMTEFCTLERPFSRHHLESMLDLVGLPEREFLGRINGWFSPRDPKVASLPEMLRGDAEAINFVIAARISNPLDRIFSFRNAPLV